MTLTDSVKKLLEQQEPEFQKRPSFVELQKFFREMQRLGIATRQEYSLPQVDTIGRTVNRVESRVVPV